MMRIISSLNEKGEGLHLKYTLIFLWVFGNAVCAKFNNWRYIPFYLCLGIIAASFHLLLDGRSAIGASGAIYGVMGAFLILYPLNSITCFYWVFLPG